MPSLLILGLRRAEDGCAKCSDGKYGRWCLWWLEQSGRVGIYTSSEPCIISTMRQSGLPTLASLDRGFESQFNILCACAIATRFLIVRAPSNDGDDRVARNEGLSNSTLGIVCLTRTWCT
jgi:hypothetical protein